MAKITKEQMENTFFRTLLLSDKMEELEGIVSGMGASLEITDDNGKTVPEKLEALIDRLIESFKHFLELEGRELEKWEKRMYSDFLYCAMQMTLEKENRLDPSISVSHLPETFGDIIKAAKTMDLDDREIQSYLDFMTVIYTPYLARKRKPLHRISHGQVSYVDGKEIHKFIDAKDIPYDNEFAYRSPTFCSLIVDDLTSSNWYPDVDAYTPPHEIKCKIIENYMKKHNLPEERSEILWTAISPSDEDYIDVSNYYYSEEHWIENAERDFQERLDEGDPDAIAAQRETEKLDRALEALKTLGDISEYKENEVLKEYTAEEIANLNARLIAIENRKAKEARNRFIVSDSEIKSRFNSFLQLYYDHKHEHFYNDVVSMVEAFLIENDLSAFALGDDYGLVAYQINKACKRIAAEIERVKRR